VNEKLEISRARHWFSRSLSESERAERSERFFWWRILAILSIAITVGSMGVRQVKRSSVGIRTAYKLVRTNDELREQIESNRHAEARLTGLKNPNELRKEALEQHQMRVPSTDEQIDVD